MSNSIPGVDCLYHVPVERSEGLKLLITTQKSTTISPRSGIDLRGDVIISFFFWLKIHTKSVSRLTIVFGNTWLGN